MGLRLDLYYFCRIGKNPTMGKIRACCARKGCPHLQTRPRKRNRERRPKKSKRLDS